jgi:alpha-galactosidase
MTASKAHSQFTLWAIVAAPLVVSADIMTMPEWTRTMLTNSGAIGIDQDPLGLQARLVSRSGGTEVWVKRLSGRARAVALLNQGLQPATVLLTGAMLGYPFARFLAVLDVWAGRTFVAGNALLVRVAPGSAVLLRVVPRRSGAAKRRARMPSHRPARGV